MAENSAVYVALKRSSPPPRFAEAAQAPHGRGTPNAAAAAGGLGRGRGRKSCGGPVSSPAAELRGRKFSLEHFPSHFDSPTDLACVSSDPITMALPRYRPPDRLRAHKACSHVNGESFGRYLLSPVRHKAQGMRRILFH